MVCVEPIGKRENIYMEATWRGGDMWQGLGTCGSGWGVGHVTGCGVMWQGWGHATRDRGIWQGEWWGHGRVWGHVAGVVTCGRVWAHVAGCGGMWQGWVHATRTMGIWQGEGWGYVAGAGDMW